MNKYIYCLFICILGLSSCVAQPLPINYIDAYNLHPLAELSQCILDSSNGSIINVI